MSKHCSLALFILCGVLGILAGPAFPTDEEEKALEYATAAYDRAKAIFDRAKATNSLHYDGPGIPLSVEEKEFNRVRAIWELVAAIVAISRNARQGYSDTEGQWVAGHYAERVGDLYASGQGGAQELAEAVRWYRKAADKGFARAQYQLGHMYEVGKGVARDLAEAHRLFTKAADAYPPGTDRNEAIQARERVARQLGAAPVPPPAGTFHLLCLAHHPFAPSLSATPPRLGHREHQLSSESPPQSWQ